MTYRTPDEAKSFKEAVELVTRPLLDRIEKLERHLAQTDRWTEQDLSEAKAEAKELSDYFNAWPGGCHDPDSCVRHLGCMYVQCKHMKKDGNDLAKEIHAYAISRPHRGGAAG